MDDNTKPSEVVAELLALGWTAEPLSPQARRKVCQAADTIERLQALAGAMAAALKLWAESGVMTDYDEEGRPTEIPICIIALGGGDLQMAAIATRAALASYQEINK